jgi:hypothetical protein
MSMATVIIHGDDTGNVYYEVTVKSLLVDSKEKKFELSGTYTEVWRI